MTAYYNEIDPQAAQWLRNLIAAGHIAPGDVDERSVWDVHPDDLAPYIQCHFFAGIGVWSHALRGAGWPDDRPVWTGSCPCQPFSDAGRGEGFADERHLWPAWFRLIGERRPRAVFGEQVASKVALAWLDHVHADLEGAGYSVGAVDTCAAGFGAPHIRQRLFFVADADGGLAGHGELQPGREQRQQPANGGAGELADDNEGGCPVERAARLHADWQPGHDAAGCGADGRLADARGQRVRDEGCRRDAGAPCGDQGEGDQRQRLRADAGHGDGRMGHAERAGLQGLAGHGDDGHEPGRLDALETGSTPAARAVGGWWAGAEWIGCSDGKARPVEPGTFPLVNGAPARLVRLRAYGNAIVAPVAQEFIAAYLSLQRGGR